MFLARQSEAQVGRIFSDLPDKFSWAGIGHLSAFERPEAVIEDSGDPLRARQ
jgi:hypothetical protein